MPDAAWKKNERDKCRELGAKRRGPLGADCSDCEPIPLIAPEFKLYSRLVFNERDHEQARENAETEGRLPVLAVREKGRNPRDRVQMDWQDFVLIYHLAVLGQRILDEDSVPLGEDSGTGCYCVAYDPEEPTERGVRLCPPSACERPDHDHGGK